MNKWIFTVGPDYEAENSGTAFRMELGQVPAPIPIPAPENPAASIHTITIFLAEK